MVDREHSTHYSGDEEIIERNRERSREVIEERQRRAAQGQADPSANAQGDKPTTAKPGEIDDEAPPRQWDVPMGGTSGPNFPGGSSKRHKPN